MPQTFCIKAILYICILAGACFALRDRRHVSQQEFIHRRGSQAPRAHARARNARKEPWVTEKVLRLRARSGRGCRTIAEMFNRRHAGDGVTIGKSYVAKTIKNNAYRLAQMERDIRNAPPRQFPKNRIWQADMTEVRFGKTDIARLFGAVDAATRANVVLERLTDLSTMAILEALFRAIRKYGKPKIIKTDNGAQFRSWLFRFALHCLHVEHRTTEPHMPWQNGRIERFFGTFKAAIRQVTMPLAALPIALDEFRFFYNHVRTHSNLGGKTPAEAWSGEPKPNTKSLWYAGWDGVLAGDYYPPT